jgi:hypothetical protein
VDDDFFVHRCEGIGRVPCANTTRPNRPAKIAHDQPVKNTDILANPKKTLEMYRSLTELRNEL